MGGHPLGSPQLRDERQHNRPKQMKLLGNKFADKVQSATLADAIAWRNSDEKTIFAVEFLEARSVNQIADFWQDELEDRFEQLLGDAA
jgi:hypothetical protein